MNLRMGSQAFMNVEIPVLWGQRAVLQDNQGRLSIVDLSGEKARPEVLADEPAPGVGFRPRFDGVVILQDSVELYSYNPRDKSVSSISLGLPDVEISAEGIRVGMMRFSGNVVSGSGVGIAVSEEGTAVGAPLPPGLARLTI